jgi:hypothetical protein
MVRPTMPPPPPMYMTPSEARLWLFKMYETLEFRARSRVFSHTMGLIMMIGLTAIVYFAGSEKWWLPFAVSFVAAYFLYDAWSDMRHSRKEKEALVE